MLEKIVYLGSLTLAAVPALAADTATSVSNSIDATAVTIAVVSGVFAVIRIVALAWTAKHVKDDASRQVLDNAIDRSLGALQQAATGEALALKPGFAMPGVPDHLRAAVQYVLDHAGDEMTRFGLTPAAVASKVNARLGLANIATNLAVSASPAPIVVKPLDPVPTAVPSVIS